MTRMAEAKFRTMRFPDGSCRILMVVKEGANQWLEAAAYAPPGSNPTDADVRRCQHTMAYGPFYAAEG